MRYSKQREAVYNVLCRAHSHPDAGEIHKEAAKIVPAISLGTVYRNLDELCESGKIKCLSVEGAVKRYDATIAPHAHFVCTCCKKVWDHPMPKVNLHCNHGVAQRAEITLYGLCENCQKTSEKGILSRREEL